MWLIYALLSAVAASLTAILAKVGLAGINSHLAMAVRTVVILALTWGMVFIVGAQKEISGLSRHNLIFLTLSGVTAGMSWLFYFKALQLGDVSKVAPIDKLSVVLTIVLAAIFLNEPFTAKTAAGSVLLATGILVLI
ncbi:MAG: EamA family transporter [Deltaproteobacteria bacterium]|jgi:transporter family protein|nr:EamA family transporter [Deltaproteobacteria bacterium]